MSKNGAKFNPGPVFNSLHLITCTNLRFDLPFLHDRFPLSLKEHLLQGEGGGGPGGQGSYNNIRIYRSGPDIRHLFKKKVSSRRSISISGRIAGAALVPGIRSPKSGIRPISCQISG